MKVTFEAGKCSHSPVEPLTARQATFQTSLPSRVSTRSLGSARCGSEPMTTHRLYDSFMETVKGGVTPKDALPALTACVERLPEPNCITLAFFLRLMSQIAAKEGQNKMSASNLGVVFGSVLLGAEVFAFSLAMKQQMEDQNTIINILITAVDELFPLSTFPYPFGALEALPEAHDDS